MNKALAIDVSLLGQLVNYDPESGALYWERRPRNMFSSDRAHNAWNARYAGQRAGCTHGDDYTRIAFAGRLHMAHRVAWAAHHGEWPQGEIDHINGIKSDNRLSNLRVVSKTLNQRNTRSRRNNSSGAQGVRCRNGRWTAQIANNGKQLHLGSFDDAQAEIAARKAAEARLGYHPNHGR
jgi:hypothetical protein